MGVNRFADRRIWLKKTTQISEHEDTFSGLADLERSADDGFRQCFSVGYGFCLF